QKTGHNRHSFAEDGAASVPVDLDLVLYKASKTKLRGQSFLTRRARALGFPSARLVPTPPVSGTQGMPETGRILALHLGSGVPGLTLFIGLSVEYTPLYLDPV